MSLFRLKDQSLNKLLIPAGRRLGGSFLFDAKRKHHAEGIRATAIEDFGICSFINIIESDVKTNIQENASSFGDACFYATSEGEAEIESGDAGAFKIQFPVFEDAQIASVISEFEQFKINGIGDVCSSDDIHFEGVKIHGYFGEEGDLYITNGVFANVIDFILGIPVVNAGSSGEKSEAGLESEHFAGRPFDGYGQCQAGDIIAVADFRKAMIEGKIVVSEVDATFETNIDLCSTVHTKTVHQT